MCHPSHFPSARKRKERIRGPPEQAHVKELDASTDLFSFGAERQDTVGKRVEAARLSKPIPLRARSVSRWAPRSFFGSYLVGGSQLYRWDHRAKRPQLRRSEQICLHQRLGCRGELTSECLVEVCNRGIQLTHALN